MSQTKNFGKRLKHSILTNRNVSKIYLIGKDGVITDDSEIEIFNKYFINIVPDIGLKVPEALTPLSLKAKNYFKCNIYPSIKTYLKEV